VYIVIDNYGTVAGSVTAGADGKWSFPMTTNYNQTYNFHAYSIDKAGNRSGDSAKFALTIDTVVAHQRSRLSLITLLAVKSVIWLTVRAPTTTVRPLQVMAQKRARRLRLCWRWVIRDGE
jgi:hypothetical protein